MIKAIWYCFSFFLLEFAISIGGRLCLFLLVSRGEGGGKSIPYLAIALQCQQETPDVPDALRKAGQKQPASNINGGAYVHVIIITPVTPLLPLSYLSSKGVADKNTGICQVRLS